jgi:large subunit ribosomal protein L9
MEVILRDDIDKLGNRGDVIKVADGYARNFLIPKKLAVAASESNKKIVEQERQAHLRKDAKLQTEAQDLGRMLAGVNITITQRAGEEGQLFGSVTSTDIANALERQGYTIDRRKVQLDAPIKHTGEFKVPVRLHSQVTVEIPVNVVAESAE